MRPSVLKSCPRTTASTRCSRAARGGAQSRVRDVQVNVDVAGHTVIEKDMNSSMVTNWTVAPAGPGSSVTVKTTWTGAGGVKGFFEKTFAPLGLKKIQAEVLSNLKTELEGDA